MVCFRHAAPLSRRALAKFLAIAGGTAMVGPPRGSAARDRDKTIVFALPDLVGNFEPQTWIGFGDSVHVVDMVARGLTHMDFSDPVPQPAVAESWSLSPDGLTYDFSIRRGLTFHDGTPVDAQAVLRTFNRMIDSTDPTRPDMSFALENLGGANIAGFSVPWPNTFRIILKKPDAALPGRLSRPDMVIISPRTLSEKGRHIGPDLSACGPYRITSVTSNERVVLEAFDGFYAGRPATRRVVMEVIPDPLAQISALASDQLNITNSVPYSNIDRLGRMEGLRFTRPAAFITTALAMNCSARKLADLRVRQAINHGIDREAIIADAFFGKAELPGYITPKSEPGYDPSHMDLSAFDPEKASALLRDAGMMGMELTILSENNGFWMRLGQVVERSLRTIGIRATVDYLDTGTFNARAFSRTGHDACFLQRSAFFPDPDGRFSPLFATGCTVAEHMTAQTGLPDQPALDQAIAAANAEHDPTRRAARYVAMNRFMAERMLPVAAMVNTFMPVVASAGLRGIPVNALGTFRTFLEDVVVDA
ncbi:ABC transporter substrate-binding periplasmic protein [Gluconacetobacter sacchari DSM 12717]|uniref:ABC transporter substrate-binding protein n=2 Tax=Gluconacetobacter sacchari TaxID=92759 RepID=A0A7W4IFC3_9PROT|nr:ABC transporter substrate-binding protein [Gluconacetobacter sacchari]MBB2161767.1 ABC transporter substrate-binding protein [Gluconacetobacter sacchari]GBQ20069.1 ABC transporter substrate-binding periplasmic protein [Gluconacetobacter sacchari DSM 12717]